MQEPDLEQPPTGVIGSGDVKEENGAAGGSDLDRRIRNSTWEEAAFRWRRMGRHRPNRACEEGV